jgi:Tfp pilus assembly protein PilX
MSRNNELVKVIRNFYQKLRSQSLATLQEQRLWLLRTFLVNKRKPEWANAGFLLPTVAMVSLVVVLISIAILFRSFERSKNASNVRVNEATLKAATPAIDRAKAKIDKLLSPSNNELPRATPTDDALEKALTGDPTTEPTKIDKYTFGDETPLTLSNGGNNLRSAWRYPVDTDNNGKFDSYTVYGIYFKNPPVVDGQYTRTRNPLEARTPPMVSGKLTGGCEDIVGTSATLVGGTGWTNIQGKLKKSFYVYAATVPITSTNGLGTEYEPYKGGNKGFSAIEYQQDRIQLPLVNNAVVYEDDIALAPGTSFNLNGRIITNSNFITGGIGSANVSLYQVSSPNSCFYEDDNAKIIVGGNIGGGGFTDDSDKNATAVHLFRGKKVVPDQASNIRDNKSVKAVPRDIAYNSLAYEQRITALVSAQSPLGNDPSEVTKGIAAEKKKLSTTPTAQEEQEIRDEQLDRYFRRRTRRVPYAEVAFNGNATTGVTNPLHPSGSGESLRPIDAWVYPVNPDDGKTETGFAKLELNKASNKLLPSATEPIKLQRELEGKEQTVGDRVLVGNGLPEVWWDKNKKKFVSTNSQDTQEIQGVTWDSGEGTRTRRTRIEQLANLGATDRDKDWELDAAKVPANPQDPVGGLRIVTGAGIYLPSSLTTTSSSAQFTASKIAVAGVTDRVWSDMMPIPSSTASTNATVVDTRTGSPVQFTQNAAPNPIVENNTPYLRMRATAVYHYKSSGYNQTDPRPIACVSSYYDPTNETTAKNRSGLPDVSLRNTNLISSNRNLTGLTAVAAGGNSNNGVVYAAPTKTDSNYTDILNYQKELKYPNGRWVNKPLRDALAKASANRTIAEKSAVDAAVCALQIFDGSISATDAVIPHGAIMETSFLDGRQIKAIHADSSGNGFETFTNRDGVNGDGTGTRANVANTAEYNPRIEDRQPLEIRTTVLDVDLLRTKAFGGEFLIPNSGLVYATRDDALQDLSAERPASGSDAQKDATQKRLSKVDFKLDPTRRPNAIMLVNGEKVFRKQTYSDVEKGFILASNLPVYIKGDFNLHTKEEFETALDKEKLTNFYTRAGGINLNRNFACRKGDPRLSKCTEGDDWRPASVLSDAINLLSANFREGYRNEGDFDLNNNLGDGTSYDAFKRNGFFNNAFVPNANWYNPTGAEATYPRDLVTGANFKPNIGGETFQGSSYINTFVTPVQRRTGQNEFNEYLMEVCPKLPASACTDDDWVVSNGTNSWKISGGIVGKALTTVQSGTTASLPVAAFQNFPRRVAFSRNSSGQLVLDGNRPRPLGVDPSGNIQEYPYTASTYPRPATSNALWFKTTTNAANPTKDNDDSQDLAGNYLLLDSRNNFVANPTANPLLVPVLQINRPFGTPSATDTGKVGPEDPAPADTGNWLQRAVRTRFNLAAAGGDTPARSDAAGNYNEDNGGLHNFVRFLENWNVANKTDDAVAAEILGSFIQTGRSAYATGPFRALLNGGYQIVGNQNRAPFYIAPKRVWGYDVGLLSQSPDLFAQKLVRIPDDLPDEFFREVGRDDQWVKTLLCAEKTSGGNAVDTDQRPQCN